MVEVSERNVSGLVGGCGWGVGGGGSLVNVHTQSRCQLFADGVCVMN